VHWEAWFGTTNQRVTIELEAQLQPRRSKGAPGSSHLSTGLRNAVIGGTNDGPRWSSCSSTLLGRSHHLAGAYAFRTRWLDSSIAHVALPTIAADLNAPAADSVWVFNEKQ
jgi:hypothetical protein